jgi:putative NADH-flavin reductase
MKGLTVVRGSISDTEKVTEAIQGCDVVMSALGSWHTPQKNILSSGMRTIIPVMQELAIHRLITLTGSGAHWSGDRYRLVDKLYHRIFKMVALRILQDSEEHLVQLDKSGLQWTCLRAPTMTRGSNSSYSLKHTLNTPLATVQRAAVVRAMLDQIQSLEELQQAPVIYRHK